MGDREGNEGLHPGGNKAHGLGPGFKFLAKLALADHPGVFRTRLLTRRDNALGADQSDVGVNIGERPRPIGPPRGRPRHLNCAHVTN